ncbi:hypothetical protein BGZ74_003292 [Mortierella antarctica]|nr:hypothetical protein BGZ74_003292 [Mortierella antarctica]
MALAKIRTPFKLVPATLDDVEAIGEISGDSFLNDTHTLMKAVWKGDNFHRQGFKDFLIDLFGNPRVDIVVAREGADGSGKVLGSIIWAKRGYPENGQAQTSATPASPMADSQTMFPPPPPPVQPALPSSPLTVTELEQTTNNAMTHFTDLLMPPGTKCRIICGMSVAPAYQSQGIGSALMKRGTDRADEDGVFCWVSSSMSGWPAYAKAGFVEVGRLELKLDDYAQGVKRKLIDADGKEVEEEWGVYVWRWMRRGPIAKEQQNEP